MEGSRRFRKLGNRGLWKVQEVRRWKVPEVRKWKVPDGSIGEEMEGSRMLPEETGATRGDRGGTAVRRLGNNPLPPEREETEQRLE